MNTERFPSPTLEALAASGELKTELHPSTAKMLQQMARYGGLSDRISVATARRRFRTLTPLIASRAPVFQVVDRVASGPAGAIPVRVVTPHGGTVPRPALVWFPGGGFVLGDLETAEPTARQLAARLGAVVICVDYRKAPEHTFDEAYDDALGAVRWVFDHAEMLGVDRQRVGVGGDSAGGNVAAVVAQEYSADSGRRPLALQVLVYPHVSPDDEPARARNASGGTLNEREMRWFEMHVAGAMNPSSLRHAPITKSDLSGLPPAVVVTAGYDPLRDEAIVYLDRLRAAGVRAEHVHFGDDVHGFFTMDLILDNAESALDTVSNLAADILDVGVEGRGGSFRPANRFELPNRLRRQEVRIRYLVERVVHQHIRAQRAVVRALGLPAARDVVALNSQIKKLDNQVRQLRRQLDDALAEDRPADRLSAVPDQFDVERLTSSD
jgi:acetyl esterase